jgi:hypothetical protein
MLDEMLDNKSAAVSNVAFFKTRSLWLLVIEVLDDQSDNLFLFCDKIVYDDVSAQM